MYSARHSNSFARQIQSDQLSQIEDLIGCCRDDLIPLLMECFNNPPVISAVTVYLHSCCGVLFFSYRFLKNTLNKNSLRN